VEKKLSLWAYPEISLKEARAERDEARSMLANGIDPAQQKRQDKHIARVNASNNFSSVARAYIEKNRRDGLAETTVSKREWFLRLVDLPLGHRPICEIAPYEILEAVRPYEAAKNDEKAHRTLQFVGWCFASQLPTRSLPPIRRATFAGRWLAGSRSISRRSSRRIRLASCCVQLRATKAGR
jgi:hypothetical protein